MKTKAVRLYGKNDLRLEEFELPEIKDDEILIEVVTDSVCMSTYKECKLGAEHERVVTGLINNIYAEAYKENDFRTMQFLDWFVKEQAEEEDNADDNVKKFELFGSDSKSLYELDAEMKSRVYSAPSLVVG